MQLVAYGAQDIYLTGNPQITFFKVVYRRHTNFSMEAIEQTWNGSVSASSRVTATISRNGDLVSRLYFQYDPEANLNINNPGHNIIDEVEIEIGGQRIDRQYGHWMETHAQLTEPNPTGLTYKLQAGMATTKAHHASNNDYHATTFQIMAGAGGVAAAAVDPGMLYIPLRFWFCQNPGLALPLIALQYHEVKIVTTFASTLVGTNLKLWADYIYLDTDERRRFAQVSHEYLIEQLQFQNQSSNTNHELNFNHPVKELIWTGGWSSGQVQDLGGLTDTALLKLNGHDRFAARELTYFTRAQVYQHHTGHGGCDTGTNNSIAVYSFALKPEEHQPSGTCNFSRIDNAQLVLSAADAIYIYAVNYNVLRIMSGMGGLAYSN